MTTSKRHNLQEVKRDESLMIIKKIKSRIINLPCQIKCCFLGNVFCSTKINGKGKTRQAGRSQRSTDLFIG